MEIITTAAVPIICMAELKNYKDYWYAIKMAFIFGAIGFLVGIIISISIGVKF